MSVCPDTEGDNDMVMGLGTFRQIVAKNPPSRDWVSRYILWRPYSVFLSWPLAMLGVRSVAVSGLNVVLAAAVGALLLWNDPRSLVIVGLGAQLVHLLDHIDGELARFELRSRKLKLSQLGNYLDGLAHRFVPFWFFAMGWAVAQSSGEQWFCIIGFLCGFLVASNIPSDPSMRIAAKLLLDEPSRSQDPIITASLGTVMGGVSGTGLLRNTAQAIKYALGFPGWHLLIGFACLADVLMEPVVYQQYTVPWRGLLLLGVSPFYTANFVMAIAKHCSLMLRLRHP